jgi:hypothetical protein
MNVSGRTRTVAGTPRPDRRPTHGGWPVRLLVLALAALASTLPRTLGAAPDGALSSMADAERAFARAAASRGIRAAFLEYLDDDAIGFRPAFGRAKDEWKARPEPANPLATTLEWEPRTGDVSIDGLLGWLTGPYTLVPGGDRTKARHGCYFSVWKRAAGGPWRVFIDLGISTPEPCTFPAGFAPAPAVARLDRALSRESLLEADRLSADVAQRPASAQGLVGCADAQLRVHLDGRQPLVGRAAADAVKADPSTWKLTRADALLAGSGDLGVTWGRAVRAGEQEPWAYVRIWRPDVEGCWKVVFHTVAR